MSNTFAGRRQFDNSQECIAKKCQWRHRANENTPEQNASIATHNYAIGCHTYTLIDLTNAGVLFIKI